MIAHPQATVVPAASKMGMLDPNSSRSSECLTANISVDDGTNLLAFATKLISYPLSVGGDAGWIGKKNTLPLRVGCFSPIRLVGA